MFHLHFGAGISKKGEGDKISKRGGKTRGRNQDFLKKLKGGTYLGGHYVYAKLMINHSVLKEALILFSQIQIRELRNHSAKK